jgi:hypothetical protein
MELTPVIAFYGYNSESVLAKKQHQSVLFLNKYRLKTFSLSKHETYEEMPLIIDQSRIFHVLGDLFWYEESQTKLLTHRSPFMFKENARTVTMHIGT